MTLAQLGSGRIYDVESPSKDGAVLAMQNVPKQAGSCSTGAMLVWE